MNKSENLKTENQDMEDPVEDIVLIDDEDGGDEDGGDEDDDIIILK